MIKTLLFSALMCCFSGFSSDIKIIVSGQSNAVGLGNGVPLPVDQNILSWSPQSSAFVAATDPLPFWEAPINTSAWPTLGRLLLKQYSNVYFTGSGHGAEPLSYWDVGQPGWTYLSTNILASGTDANWFIWYQGEADAQTGNADYANKLADFIGRVRALVKNPSLNVIIVQIETIGVFNAVNFPFCAQIQQAQYNYTLTDDHAFLVQTLGFALQFDGVHLTQDSQNMLARACAKQILGAAWFVGPQGVAGAQGQKGDKGDRGDSGSDGVSPQLPAGILTVIPQNQGAQGVLLKKRWIRADRKCFDLYRQE